MAIGVKGLIESICCADTHVKKEDSALRMIHFYICSTR